MKRRASRWATWRPSLRELAVVVAVFALWRFIRAADLGLRLGRDVWRSAGLGGPQE